MAPRNSRSNYEMLWWICVVSVSRCGRSVYLYVCSTDLTQRTCPTSRFFADYTAPTPGDMSYSRGTIVNGTPTVHETCIFCLSLHLYWPYLVLFPMAPREIDRKHNQEHIRTHSEISINIWWWGNRWPFIGAYNLSSPGQGLFGP